MMEFNQETAELIGEQATYIVDGYLEFAVNILAVRTRYGNTDYRIAPVTGKGEKWVSENKVRL